VNNNSLLSQDEKESPAAEQLRTLLKRLYGPAEGQEKLDLHEGSNDFYLAHALIQLALFSIKQECGISFDIQKGCINDGTNSFIMNLKAFATLTDTSQEDFVDFVRRHFYRGNREEIKIKRLNPGNREGIKIETLYFYNCTELLRSDSRVSIRDLICDIQGLTDRMDKILEREKIDSYSFAYYKATHILLGMEDWPKGESFNQISSVIRDLTMEEIKGLENDTSEQILQLSCANLFCRLKDLLDNKLKLIKKSYFC
jgi:hypothetical protein